MLGALVDAGQAIDGQAADGMPTGGARYWSTRRLGGRRQSLETIQRQIYGSAVCDSG